MAIQARRSKNWQNIFRVGKCIAGLPRTIDRNQQNSGYRENLGKIPYFHLLGVLHSYVLIVGTIFSINYLASKYGTLKLLCFSADCTLPGTHRLKTILNSKLLKI